MPPSPRRKRRKPCGGSDAATADAAKPRKPYRSVQDERSFQELVVETLDRKYPSVFYNANPNGVYYGRDRGLAAQIARAVKKAGSKNGVPDLQIIECGGSGQPCAWAELKQGTQPVSADQLAFHAELRKRGHEVAVIKTLDDFESWLQTYLFNAGSNPGAPLLLDTE
jgi:hypothetical protein